MPTWSERIAALEAAGWTLTGLAREIGLSVQALSDVKQGRTVEPRGMAAVQLHRLHEALSASHAGENPDPSPEPRREAA